MATTLLLAVQRKSPGGNAPGAFVLHMAWR